ncbi:MAG: hypothetical protein NDJ65_08535 [Paludibacteraceae bacterium]|nr:hypothetical protein [Paludibacteraceae bacterium]
MKKIIILIFLTIGIANSNCQNSDSIVAAINNSEVINNQSPQSNRIVFTAGSLVYPLSGHTNGQLKRHDRHYVYPLLILNNVIIRDQEKVECFRSELGLIPIERIKLITKEKAEKLGIPDVPKDGVVFVKIKKGVYVDLSCEK